MQTTLLGFAIALILALLAALVGPHFVNWNDHRAYFEAEASRIVGLEVRVSGNIDAGILPFPSVTLRDIAIGPAGKASRLSAKSLGIELGLGPLLRGEIRATDMKLVAPQFSIGLDRQGRIDWPPLALAAETLSIDRLSVEDGRVTLNDAGSGARMVLDQMWFAGEVRSLIGPIRGKGEFVSSGALYGYDVSAGRNGPEGIKFRLGLKNDERPLSVEADGMLAFEGGSPRFDGALTLARPAGAVLASGKAKGYEPWRLTSKVKARAASAVLDEVLFQYGPDERATTLAGTADFKFGAQPQLQGKLAARQVDLDRLLATPNAPRRLPVAAVQAFGELIGSALRPTWPVRLSVAVDAMTLGGATLQNVGTDLRSGGAEWTLDRLEFRAPGFTQVKVSGRLYPLGQGLGFAGGASVDSNDPRGLVAWLSGRPAASASLKPWHAKGDVTLGSDRIAVERLKTEIERGSLEGRLAYSWPAGTKPARLEADLRAPELDLDAMQATAESALSGLGLEAPGELALALEVGRARIAGLDARNIAARLTLDEQGLAIERLSIADFGDASIAASGRIRTLTSPGGNITVDLNARDVGGLITLAEKFAPPLAGPLRRLTASQKTAAVRANVSLGNNTAETSTGAIELAGLVGAVRVNVSASATGKREAFSMTDLGALAATDVRIDGRMETDDAKALLALLGLERMAVTVKRPARLTLSAKGPLTKDLKFEARLDAGPIDAAGSGVIQYSSGQPGAISLDRFDGTVGGSKVQGRLALRFGDATLIDGAVETEWLDGPAAIATAIGMPARRATNATGWSAEPFAWNPPGLTGRVEFKAQRAAIAPSLMARDFRGMAQFSPSEVVFEEVAGEMAKGRFEGRLAIANGGDGLSARMRVGLIGADAGAAVIDSERPPMSGRLAFQAELEGVGRSPAAFIGSLTGFGSIDLERAQLAGLNPGVFGTVTRAIELGIPTDGNRIREFVSGVLDNATLPVPRATARISVNAGQARFSDIVIRASGADLEASASVDLADATLNALLTFTGLAATPGAARPSVLVSLKGPLTAPARSIDTGPLTSWLTLRAVEQQSKQIDMMERAGRELSQPPKPQEPVERPAEQPAGERPAATPMSVEIPPTTSRISPNVRDAAPSDSRAPALPPPVDVPASPKPRLAPRAGNTAPLVIRPPGLIGAQN